MQLIEDQIGEELRTAINGRDIQITTFESRPRRIELTQPMIVPGWPRGAVASLWVDVSEDLTDEQARQQVLDLANTLLKKNGNQPPMEA